MKGRKEQHGIPMHTHGLKDSHLNRFLKDEAQPLSSYGVFHGDDRQQLGEPLPTGSLRRPSAGSLGATHSNHTAFAGSYIIRPTMSLHTLQKNSPYLSKTMGATKTLSASSYAPSQQGTAYLYQSGTTFRSTSGEDSERLYAAVVGTLSGGGGLHELKPPQWAPNVGVPPTQYKSWTSEYADEHRDPRVSLLRAGRYGLCVQDRNAAHSLPLSVTGSEGDPQ
jgi:hypothetical protein